MLELLLRLLHRISVAECYRVLPVYLILSLEFPFNLGIGDLVKALHPVDDHQSDHHDEKTQCN